MNGIVKLDESRFDDEVIQSAQPVLVDFSAAWCGPCKKLDPVVEQIAGAYAGRLKVVKVDVDEAPSLAARFAVLSVPTLLFIRDGEVRHQVVGLQSRSALEAEVEKLLD